MPDEFLAQYVPEAEARRAAIAEQLQQMDALREEAEKIDAFLALMGGKPSQTRRTNGTKTTTPSPTGETFTGPRPSAEMIEKVKKYIGKHPGTTIAAMSSHLRVHTNTIRRSVKVLQIEQQAVRSLGRQFEDRAEHFAPADWTPEQAEAPVAA